MTISSREIPLAAQGQQFLNNHLARVPVFPNQQGTHEMRDRVLSSVGAQDMDTSRYQVPDLGDVEFYWENDQLDVDALFRTGLDTPFSPKTFQDLEMGGGQAENPILLDEEEDKENSLLFQQHQSLRDNTTPCIAEKSSTLNKNRKCS